jgi:hypothetical protein
LLHRNQPENEVNTMIALKTLISGSVLAAVMAFPLASYAGDMGDDYHHGYAEEHHHHGYGEEEHHHGYGEEGDHHKGGDKGHVMHGHLRVDVYIHKAGEEKHKRHAGEQMKSHWEHAHHGGWDHEKFSKMHDHHGDWDHSRYGYEGRAGRDDDRYDKAAERQGHWDAEQYGDESGGDRGDYRDGGGWD